VSADVKFSSQSMNVDLVTKSNLFTAAAAAAAAVGDSRIEPVKHYR